MRNIWVLENNIGGNVNPRILKYDINPYPSVYIKE